MSIADRAPPDVPLVAEQLLLDVEGLSVSLLESATGKYRPIVVDAALSVQRGAALGLTGESGGGKSTTVQALAGRLPSSARVRARKWRLMGKDVIDPGWSGDVSGARVNMRIREIAQRGLFMIVQDSRSALVPHRTVAWHLRAAARANRRQLTNCELVRDLRAIGFAEPCHVLGRRPVDLSGGECQRVQFAIAKRLPVQLLIADEPFSFVHQEWTDLLLQDLKRGVDQGKSLLLVSHDIQAMKSLTNRIAVMCSGYVVEEGPTSSVLDLEQAGHPHTRMLLRLTAPHFRGVRHQIVVPDVDIKCRFAQSCDAADVSCRIESPAPQKLAAAHVARCIRAGGATTANTPPRVSAVMTTRPAARITAATLVRATDVSASHVSSRWIGAPVATTLPARSLTIRAGERVGLGGDSGSGKTTFARMLMGLHSIHGGTIERFGDMLLSNNVRRKHRTRLWRRMQWVSQDSDVALDPMATVQETLSQGYRAAGITLQSPACWEIPAALLARMRMDSRMLGSLNAHLSGGERRRVAIARSLAGLGFLLPGHSPTEDRLLICDEPTVGVDVWLQSLLTDLLLDAQRELRLTYLFISHDSEFLSRICDRQVYWRLPRSAEEKQEGAECQGPELRLCCGV